LAVSKTKSIEDIKLAYDAGQRDFGENKVQELNQKADLLASSCPNINWHFIGSLQSNKINNLLSTPNLVSIHSIDSIKLLNKLLNKKPDKRIGIFLQVNTSGEDEKSGFSEFAEIEEASSLLKSESFYLQGLMTIGKIRTDDFENDAKACFLRLNEYKERLNSDDLELSMGMSSDYKIAIDCGSDWIRIGSGIFGSR
jgi:pyridoxal phosphate enzyme (YggS family)